MGLERRVEKLETSAAGAGMHIIPWQLETETEDAAQARYVAETGSTIGPRDMLVMIKKFGST